MISGNRRRKKRCQNVGSVADMVSRILILVVIDCRCVRSLPVSDARSRSLPSENGSECEDLIVVP